MANSIIKPKAAITTNTLTRPDLNEIKTNFMGYVAQSTNNPPQVTTNNGNLIAHFSQTGTRGYQIFRPYNSMRLFVRGYNLNSDNAWRDWVEISINKTSAYNWYGTYPAGRVYDTNTTRITIPFSNPSNVSPTLGEVYVYDGTGAFTQLTNCSITIWNNVATTISLPFSSSHAGKLLRVSIE